MPALPLSDRQLMRMHVEALFTHDAQGRLLRVNEPNGEPAPRFFLGRTLRGHECFFRHDIRDELKRELLAAVKDDEFREEDFQNAQLLEPFLSAWMPDVPHCQPMYAMVIDERAVAVCASVRLTSAAYEAGVDTAVAYRGRGYAVQVVAAWAQAVRDLGIVPLYSTSWRNEASRAVARKLGLIQFGNDLHLI